MTHFNKCLSTVDEIVLTVCIPFKTQNIHCIKVPTGPRDLMPTVGLPVTHLPG